MKVLALEGAEHGISASAICPGYVRTPIVESQIEAQSLATGVAPERVVEDVLLAPQAVKRLLEPEEVAETAAFLPYTAVREELASGALREVAIKGYEPVRRPIVALRRRDAVVPEDLVEGLLSSVSRDELER